MTADAWEAVERPGPARAVHVVPLADLIDHDLVEECVCIPGAELVPNPARGDCWLIVHHSLDGREQYEQ